MIRETPSDRSCPAEIWRTPDASSRASRSPLYAKAKPGSPSSRYSRPALYIPAWREIPSLLVASDCRIIVRRHHSMGIPRPLRSEHDPHSHTFPPHRIRNNRRCPIRQSFSQICPVTVTNLFHLGELLWARAYCTRRSERRIDTARAFRRRWMAVFVKRIRFN